MISSSLFVKSVLLVFVALTISCSRAQKKQPQQSISSSQLETIDEYLTFPPDQIERQKAIESYRQMRLDSWGHENTEQAETFDEHLNLSPDQIEKQRAIDEYRQMRWKTWSQESTKQEDIKVEVKTSNESLGPSAEEIRRREATERYRQMRLNDQHQKSVKSVSNVNSVRRKTKTITAKVKKKIYNTDIDSQKIELEQNFALYCIKKRWKVNENGSCQDYTQNILQVCLEKFDYGENDLTRCVKSKLR